MGRRQTIDPRIRAEVISTYGDYCWLGLPGCTRVGAEDDHIVPHAHGGRDTVANIRRACKHCNASRQDRVLYGYGAKLHMVIVPPASEIDAIEFVVHHAAPGSARVSYGGLANAMGLDGPATPGERRTVAMAWDGAYRSLSTCADPVDAWLIRSMPYNDRHPRMLDEWIALDYDVHVIDPGFTAAWDRATTDTERKLIRQWYSLHLSQSLIDSRRAARQSRLNALGLRSLPAAKPPRVEW